MTQIILITDEDRTEYYVCAGFDDCGLVLRRSSDPLLRQSVRKYRESSRNQNMLDMVMDHFELNEKIAIKSAQLIEMPAWMELPELPTVRPVARVVDFGHREGWIPQGITLQWAQGFPDAMDEKGRRRYVGEALYTLADALAVIQGKAKLLIATEEEYVAQTTDAPTVSPYPYPLTWAQIVELVGEVTGSKQTIGNFNPEKFIGHEMAGINFNSLARIIEAVRTGKRP